MKHCLQFERTNKKNFKKRKLNGSTRESDQRSRKKFYREKRERERDKESFFVKLRADHMERPCSNAQFLLRVVTFKIKINYGEVIMENR